jgi:tetraacyldisaccharide 4'-kinase
MPLRMPQFWERPAGLAAFLLSPAAATWDLAGRLHRALGRPYSPPVPVVCVGNLMVGGAGKTPVALALGDWLAARGVRAQFLGRGYCGSLAGPVRVDLERHDAAAVGDEALLLARCLPCWIARNRGAGIRAAVATGAEAVLVDDGFQSPAFAKTLSLVVVDAGYRFGNARVVPAGPLRESLEGGLARADAVVLVHAFGDRVQGKTDARLGGRSTLNVQAVPVAGERFAGMRLVAFAGIGRPQKFFATLRRLGAQLVEMRAFPDHYRYRERDIAALRGAAARLESQLVTTAKDIVRVPSAERDGIEVLEIVIRWREPEKLARLMQPIIEMTRGDARLSLGG